MKSGFSLFSERVHSRSRSSSTRQVTQTCSSSVARKSGKVSEAFMRFRKLGHYVSKRSGKEAPMDRCCEKCNLTHGCKVAVERTDAEDSLCLLDETFDDLFKWYDARSAGWKKRANPKLWEEVRRQWKECV